MRYEEQRLRERGIAPSAQRVAVAAYVLRTHDHPSADDVWRRVREGFPLISRATVYNTLNLFVAKGLLRQFVLREGCTVFDCNVDNHHHFIDVETGAIQDVPWQSIAFAHTPHVKGCVVTDYHVILKGFREKKS